MEAFMVEPYEAVNPAKILRYMYLSSIGPSRNSEIVSELGITHIADLSNTHPVGDALVSNYLRISIEDEEHIPILDHLDQFCEFIDSSQNDGGVVLVNCMAGQSRSATFVIAYLMKKFRLNLKESFEHVKKRKPNIGPNPGFMKQLIQWEERLGIPPSFDLTEHLASEIIQVFPELNKEDVINKLKNKNNNVSAVVHEIYSEDSLF